MEKINNFQGKYRFLSNFYPALVLLDGIEYPTVEHAYQAAKTLDNTQRFLVCIAPSPGRAKAAGRHLSLRSDWEEVKLKVMEDLLRQKFKKSLFKTMLLETGNAELIEGNTWGDRFWGVCNGVGQNNLGKLLMKIRDERLQ
jgi:N-glycosidase YbiA